MMQGKDYDGGHEIASATERPFRRELAKNPPRSFDVKRVAAAYRAYLKNPGRYPVMRRPNDPPTPARQLSREVDEVLSRKTARPKKRPPR